VARRLAERARRKREGLPAHVGAEERCAATRSPAMEAYAEMKTRSADQTAFGLGLTAALTGDPALTAAAIMIQKHFRGKQVRSFLSMRCRVKPCYTLLYIVLVSSSACPAPPAASASASPCAAARYLCRAAPCRSAPCRSAPCLSACHLSSRSPSLSTPSSTPLPPSRPPPPAVTGALGL
jgi:hypothetical protein